MTDPAPGTLLSLGHGYTAQALARLLLPAGWRIIGTTRTPDQAQALRATGIEPAVWPGIDLAPLLGRATHVLMSMAPGPAGDPVLAAHPGLFRDAPAAWAGYLSTTVVYGDHKGGWVDEETPATPRNARGTQRLAAEGAWRATGLPLHVFRLAGIYGPGRGPFEKVRDGTARRIIKEGQVFSRIHVDDIARVLAASMRTPAPGTIYNVCDDDPAPPQDVIGLAATLLGLPMPPAVAYADADLTPMGRSFYEDSKRVRNDRIKRDLGVRLLYPTYREGLEALLKGDRGAKASPP